MQGVITAAWPLHLDDFSSQIRKEERAVGPGENSGEVGHEQAGER